jgi:hypothetical protein
MSRDAKVNLVVADVAWMAKDSPLESTFLIKIKGRDGVTHDAEVIEFGGSVEGPYVVVQEPFSD